MTADISCRNSWPLARVLILLLAGAFGGLVIDIRVEHVEVVREQAVGWVPIIYSAVMSIACVAGAIVWNRTARLILLPLFLLALVVGGLGFYFHTHGNIAKVVDTSMHAWTNPHQKHSHAPPQLAPLSFAGLGTLGFLACLKRFNR